MLADGTYNVIVFDAEDDFEGGVRVDVAILDGEHKGATLSIHSSDWSVGALDLLGIPATVSVTRGVFSIDFER